MVINDVHIKGRVLRSADAFQNGRTMDTLYFAVSVPTKKDPERKVYVDCLAFPDTYEQFDGFLEAGEVVTIDGTLVYRTWTDSNGTKRSGTEVLVETIKTEE